MPSIHDESKAHEQYDRIVVINFWCYVALLVLCFSALVYLCRRQRKTVWPAGEVGFSAASLRACYRDQMWSFAEISMFCLFGIILSAVVYYKLIDTWIVFLVCSTLSAFRYFFLLKILTQYAINELINARSHVYWSKNLRINPTDEDRKMNLKWMEKRWKLRDNLINAIAVFLLTFFISITILNTVLIYS